MRGKIFRGKIRIDFSEHFFVVRNYNFKAISIKQIEPNFVRMKVSEFKTFFQSVLRISAAKNF